MSSLSTDAHLWWGGLRAGLAVAALALASCGTREGEGIIQITWDDLRDRPRQIRGRFPAEGADAEAAARAFLGAHAGTFHLGADGVGLALVAERRGLLGSYLRFGQTWAGAPVLGGEV